MGGRLPAYAGGALIWVAVGLMAGTYTVTVRAVCYVGLVLLSAMTIPTVARELVDDVPRRRLRQVQFR